MTTHRRIAAIGAIAVVMVVAVWYLALWRPAGQHLGAAHRSHAVATAKIGQLQTTVAGLRAIQHQIPADRVTLARLEAAVPADPQLDGALEQLSRVAFSSGVTLSSVQPGTPTVPSGSSSQASSGSHAGSSSSAATASNVSSIQVAMAATGSYGQLMHFLDGLASMPRTVVVDQLTLSGSHQLSASIIAHIFYAGHTAP